MKYTIYSLSLALAFGFSACKDDEDNPSRREILTGSTWTVTARTSAGVADTLEACETDDRIKFNTNGTAVTDQGAVKCDPTDPQTSSGTWSLSSDEKVLTLSEDGISIALNITSISSNKIQVSFTDPIFGIQGTQTWETR
jgi:hypothetical protein